MMYPGMISNCDGSEPTIIAHASAIDSSSHTFVGAQQINLAVLLAQSGYGNALVYSVDIDVRSTSAGIHLARGDGTEVLQPGDSRFWCGEHQESYGNYGQASAFTLILAADDEVVVNWSEVRQ